MATWMAHLRIADKLLDLFEFVEQPEFVMGNIAPDSGIPYGTEYVPNKTTSHFMFKNSDGKNTFGWQQFSEKYLSYDKIQSYNKKEFSFYLGYLTHLLSDFKWIEVVHIPLKEKDGENYRKDKNATVWKWKKDWYDLDHRFIRDNPDFRAFLIYKNTVDFNNTYLSFFSETAFDERRSFIVEFYSHFSDDLEREYIWLTEKIMKQYIEKAVEFILEKTEPIRTMYEKCHE